MTRVPLDEFPPLVPPVATAFQARMAAWRLDGTPRTARRFPVSQHCPLPTPEERLLCLLASVKTSALPVVQGRLCRLGQSTAQQWMPLLLPAWLAAWRALGDAPARSRTALAQQLGVAEAAAAPVVTPREEERTPRSAAPAVGPPSPLVAVPAPHGASSAPKPRLHSRRVRAASTRTIRSTRSCGSMPPSRASC